MAIEVFWSEASGEMARIIQQKAIPATACSYYRILLAIAFLPLLINVTHMILPVEVDGSSHPEPELALQSQKDQSSRQSAAESLLHSTSQTKELVQQYRSIPKRKAGIQYDLVQAGDYIYNQTGDWDAAPIILESHKLAFFTIPKVGCTVWKQLFRRMMGYEDWKSQDYEKLLPHNPQHNGLRYLYHYSLPQANEIMSSPEWTRAMMVRDPKQRFLSAFLDKALSNDHLHIMRQCCPDDGSCVPDAQNLTGFLRLCSVCPDSHWRPQDNRLDDRKYWPYMDVVGRVETAAQDAQQLLQRIGAWETYGATGWGADGTRSIFESKKRDGAGSHTTYAQWEVWKWYTPAIEQAVEQFYHGDYENPLFRFTRNQCLTCPIETKNKTS